ncbi:MAG: hypothetical protein DHS20C11_15610 [Lysobacteraceae bacterium]|nr:MAG: hypothetical protein DHS20C11_15610 [Xanthomonadaceae bacterium]
MYSQCPECDALYVLRAAELSAAGGMLRCGRCGVVFDALERLRDGTPASENLRLKSIAGEAPPPTLEPWQSTLSPLNDEVDDLFLQSRPQRPLKFTTEEEQAISDEESAPIELGVKRPTRKAHNTNAWWAVSTVVLLLALLAQSLYGWRETWYYHPMTADYAKSVCETLGCTIPLRRDPSVIRMVDRSIRRHPSVDDALMITATLVNDGPHPVAFPILEISLSGLDGRPMALRRFQPEQYLDASIAFEQGMPSNSFTPVVFETVDPGSDAVAFEFRFH